MLNALMNGWMIGGKYIVSFRKSCIKLMPKCYAKKKGWSSNYRISGIIGRNGLEGKNTRHISYCAKQMTELVLYCLRVQL